MIIGVVTCRLGQMLREHVRQGDIAGRCGGDEFGVNVPGVAATEG